MRPNLVRSAILVAVALAIAAAAYAQVPIPGAPTATPVGLEPVTPPPVTVTPTSITPSCDANCVQKVILAQSVDYLCWMVASVSGARSGSALGGTSKPMKCVENTDAPQSPGTVTPTPIPPPYKVGMIETAGAGGTTDVIFTGSAIPGIVRVELRADGNAGTSCKYGGVVAVVNGKWSKTWNCAALRDGAEHYLEAYGLTATDQVSALDNSRSFKFTLPVLTNTPAAKAAARAAAKGTTKK